MKTVIEEMNENNYNGKINFEKEFDKALENEMFKEFVSKIKLDRKKMMKYTTTLEECCTNYNTCINCKGLINCPYKLAGYCYLPNVIDGRLEFDYKPCKYLKKQKEKTKYQDNVYTLDVPIDIKEASIKNINNNDSNRYDAIIWINTFLGNYKKGKIGKGLYLYGNFGCGKTYLISALFNELAKNDVKSAIIFWPEFLRDLKASFATDFKQKYEYIKKVPLLLIDDIGAEVTTPWGRDEILCPLMQYRMEAHLPTFFTSNLDMESLEEHLKVTKDQVNSIKAKRIIERINQMTEQITMISKNLRG